jgi:tetratricopeptide (TPR) repeat protein
MIRTPVATILILVVCVAALGCATVNVLESIDALLKQARELLDARRFDEALTKLTEVIRRDPMQWRAYLYSAQAYIGKRDWTAALGSARKALELAPAESATVTTLGDALFGGGLDALQRGAFRDASSLFGEYIRLRPADVQGYLNAGRAYLGTRDWADAGRVLAEGLGRASDPAARRELARTLLDGGRQAVAAGNDRGAIALLREYVRVETTDVSAYVELAKAYWVTGDRSDAVATFRRVLELAPQNEEARRFLLFSR